MTVPFFENSHFLGSSVAINMPFGGILLKWLGLESVQPKSFKNLLKNSEDIIFMPGGFEEASICSHKNEKIFILNRKGFIKYALEFGYSIYPVYAFNENKLFRTLDYFYGLRLFLNKVKIPGVVYFGKYGHPFAPEKNVELKVVLGEPIVCEKVENPT
jgi:hypothetical protein